MTCLACLATSLSLLLSPASTSIHKTFQEPVDAMSVVFPAGTDAADTALRFRKKDGAFSPWQPLEIDNDDDPTSRVSNLVVFSEPSKEIDVQTHAAGLVLQPILVSKDPPSFLVARSLGDYGESVPAETPKILTRAEWGADENLRIFSQPSSHSSSSAGNATTTDYSDATSSRQQDCLNAQRNYPDEFKTDGRVITKDENGNRLLWPETFSKQIKLLVIHHTAMGLASDTRSGIERMRALYQYHAVSKGWGDVGYRYIIDETGQIYEGRAGGDLVVSGHSYCHNINSLGIALMGNFEEDAPPQVQIASLQWLLKHLADEEHINLNASVTFHGVTYPSPIVGHRDLLDTTCPGFYLYGVLSQIRSHVIADATDATVTYPVKPVQITSNKPFVNIADQRRAERMAKEGITSLPVPVTVGLSAVGGTSLQGLPGEQRLISIAYQAGTTPMMLSASLGTIKKSQEDIGLWVDRSGQFDRLRTTLPSPKRIDANQLLTMRLKIQFPMNEGTATFSIGSVTYTLASSGRRVRDPAAVPSTQTYTRPTPSLSNFSTSSVSSISSSSDSSDSSVASDSSRTIRILLSTSSPTITLSSSTTIGGQNFAPGSLTLTPDSSTCTASQSGKVASSGILRIDEGTGTFGIGSNRYHGVLECRVINGSIVLINELPLETYMHGISEEPDTEPYEKQRAFAIAARTYAFYYIDPNHRKFPGKPYDGSDSAALFQKYTGVTSEVQNPNWVKAVDSTANSVLTKNSQVIKPPYFSSDSGQTKSPADVGWATFPFAEVFTSKADPWCSGMTNSGHGVGMSGCGAKGQANEGKTGEQILQYYYPGTLIKQK